MTNNRLDKSFGPVGASAGLFIFIAGLILTYFHLSGIVLLLFGAFFGFTHSSAMIDYEKKRIRFSTNLFGVIRTGTWLPVDPSMKIGIRESNQTYRAYSRGNRPLDIDQHDFRLILFDSSNKEIMPIKKTSSLIAAKTELETMHRRLGLTELL